MQVHSWPGSGEQKLALRHGLFTGGRSGEGGGRIQSCALETLTGWRKPGFTSKLLLMTTHHPSHPVLSPPLSHTCPPCPISSSLSHMQAGGGFQSVWEGIWLSSSRPRPSRGEGVFRVPMFQGCRQGSTRSSGMLAETTNLDKATADDTCTGAHSSPHFSTHTETHVQFRAHGSHTYTFQTTTDSRVHSCIRILSYT